MDFHLYGVLICESFSNPREGHQPLSSELCKIPVFLWFPDIQVQDQMASQAYQCIHKRLNKPETESIPLGSLYMDRLLRVPFAQRSDRRPTKGVCQHMKTQGMCVRQVKVKI